MNTTLFRTERNQMQGRHTPKMAKNKESLEKKSRLEVFMKNDKLYISPWKVQYLQKATAKK